MTKIVLTGPLNSKTNKQTNWRWLGVVKMSCILHQQGVQLILAYSWPRPVVLVAGKGEGNVFFFISSVSSLSILSLFLSCPFLLSPLLYFLSHFSLPLEDDRK